MNALPQHIARKIRVKRQGNPSEFGRKSGSKCKERATNMPGNFEGDIADNIIRFAHDIGANIRGDFRGLGDDLPGEISK